VTGTITAAGGKARFVAADLTDRAQLDHLVEQAGLVDVLVNNAGFSWFGPTADLDVATFDRLFAANVRAAYFLVAALAPKMAARRSGSIVNIGSMAGQIGLAGVQVVRGTLDEDEPAVLRVRADVVDLHRHLVFGTFYPGVKVLVGRAAQRDAEQQAAFLYLVADREHGQAGPAGIREAAHTAR
jgi:NAD(P)-dependent dehydrogenase (short-subunit alcohol dehydrogenase family)